MWFEHLGCLANNHSLHFAFHAAAPEHISQTGRPYDSQSTEVSKGSFLGSQSLSMDEEGQPLPNDGC